MIKSIYIENYRGFEKHTINFKDITLMVGKNNAGKSTIIEILRICSLITRRYKTATYNDVPVWIDDLHTAESRYRIKGISPNIKKIIRQYNSIPHRYVGTPYAKITFINDFSIEIFYNETESIFAILRDSNQKVIKNRAKAKDCQFPNIATLPQIGPLNLEEKILQDETIKKAEMLSTTSLHFRNKLLNNQDIFNEYKGLVADSWSGLLLTDIQNDDGNLSLFVRENDFEAEVGSMGHGLQMWLQLLWFIYTSEDADTLIIDEPDVYLHADLQNKLYKILLQTKKQIILSSHSFEFILNTDPKNIVIVQKNKSKSSFANDNPNVQKIINDIGYSANLELIKFANSGKCVFVEGYDRKVLSCFANIMGYHDFEEIPIIPIGGRTQWKKVLGAVEVTDSRSGHAISNYCILDKDYFSDINNTHIQSEAIENNINLTIWNSKEIENYLIHPAVICRLLNSSKATEAVSQAEIEDIINVILEENKQCVINHFGSTIQNDDKSLDFATVYSRASEIVEQHWDSLKHKIQIASGKEILKQIRTQIQEKYQVSFSDIKLAKSFKREEIHEDIVNFFANLYR